MDSRRDIDLASLGECMVEFFCEGAMAEATTFSKSYGGDALNALIAIARLGGRVAFVSKVGDDPFGPFLRKSWEREGVDLGWTRTAPGFNGIYFISVAPGGQRSFTYYRSGSAASQMAPEDLEEVPFHRFSCFLVTGISQAISESSRAAALAACRKAKEAGCRVCYDPNLRVRLWDLRRARAAMEEVLPYVDVVLPSLPEDSKQLIGLEAPCEVADWFLSRGASWVAGKMGSEGAFVADAKGISFSKPLATEAVDTTGAGDAFNGGFLWALAKGLSGPDACRLGVTVSSLKVRGRGAVRSLPTRDQVEAVWLAPLPPRSLPTPPSPCTLPQVP